MAISTLLPGQDVMKSFGRKPVPSTISHMGRLVSEILELMQGHFQGLGAPYHWTWPLLTAQS